MASINPISISAAWASRSAVIPSESGTTSSAGRCATSCRALRYPRLAPAGSPSRRRVRPKVNWAMASDRSRKMPAGPPGPTPASDRGSREAPTAGNGARPTAGAEPSPRCRPARPRPHPGWPPPGRAARRRPPAAPGASQPRAGSGRPRAGMPSRAGSESPIAGRARAAYSRGIRRRPAPVEHPLVRHDLLERDRGRQRRVGRGGDQPTAVRERREQPAGHGPDRLRVEVDQDVAAEDQVHPPDARRQRGVIVLGEVVVFEADEPADLVTDDPVVTAFSEVWQGGRRARAAERPVAVNAPSRLGRRGFRDVGCQQIGSAGEPLLNEGDGQRIGLLAGGAPRASGTRTCPAPARPDLGSTVRRINWNCAGSRKKYVSPTVSSAMRSCSARSSLAIRSRYCARSPAPSRLMAVGPPPPCRGGGRASGRARSGRGVASIRRRRADPSS